MNEDYGPSHMGNASQSTNSFGGCERALFQNWFGGKKTKPTILNGFLSQFLFNPSIESPKRLLGKSW